MEGLWVREVEGIVGRRLDGSRKAEGSDAQDFLHS